MDFLLPDELVSSITASIRCREAQIQQLVGLLDFRFSNPSTIILHGVRATGKSLTLKAVLDSIDTPYVIVRSQECITTRHLLERTITAAKEALSHDDDQCWPKEIDGRCESISIFVVQLQRLLESQGKFILVFDGIDHQREALPTLLPAIARLGEIIPNLTVILIVTAPQPRALNHAGVPYVHFPPYTRSESLSIVSESPLPIIPDGPLVDSTPISDTDISWLWPRFCGAVWDSLGQAAARDIVNFRAVCARLWRPFTQPIVQGVHAPRELSKLMVKNRTLFQSEDALQDPILPYQSSAIPTTTSQPSRQVPPRYPHHTAHLLLAAYLASHIPQRKDLQLFSKSSDRRRRRPRASTITTASDRRRKTPRHLLGAAPFPLERLLAIFHAISAGEDPAPESGSAELMAQVAVLGGLRLLIRGTDEGSVGGGKWRAGFGWEFARGVARGVGFDLEAILEE